MCARACERFLKFVSGLEPQSCILVDTFHLDSIGMLRPHCYKLRAEASMSAQTLYTNLCDGFSVGNAVRRNPTRESLNPETLNPETLNPETLRP